NLPIVCGQNTRYDSVAHRCVGTGDPNQTSGCSSSCSAPGASTVCITGAAKDFVSGAAIAPTAMSQPKVRVYDPIAFATNPTGTLPLREANIEQNGCFVVDGVPRPGSGLIALSIDDVDPSVDQFATAGVGAVLQPGLNVTGLNAYAISKTTV